MTPDPATPIIAAHVPRVGSPDETHYCACGQTFGWPTTWAAHVAAVLADRLTGEGETEHG